MKKKTKQNRRQNYKTENQTNVTNHERYGIELKEKKIEEKKA